VAKEIKEASPQTEVEIYSEEPCHYYPRPKLIELISGEIETTKVFFYPADWYEKNGIKVCLNSKVEKVSPAKKTIQVEKRGKVSFDNLVIAAGAHPVFPPIEGVGLAGVFYLHTLEDAFKINTWLKDTNEVIVIGGGVLGVEVAFALKKRNRTVTIVEMSEHPMSKQLDREAGLILKNSLEKTGIKILTSAHTHKILGIDRVEGVLLSNDIALKAELVIVCAGVRSNIEFLRDSGINLCQAITVNSYLATNYPDLFACGDIAEFKGKIYPFIPAAIEQAEIVAGNIVHDDKKEYIATIPFRALKAQDVELACIGELCLGEKGIEELKVTSQKGRYKKVVFRNNQAAGAIVLGDKKEFNAFLKFVSEKMSLDAVKATIKTEVHNG